MGFVKILPGKHNIGLSWHLKARETHVTELLKS